MMRALAMRLHHLGLEVCMQGDMEAFPLGPGDCSCVPRDPASCRPPRRCAVWPAMPRRGWWCVTAEPDGATAALADALLVIPAQTMASDVGSESVLPMGSLFEGAMFVVFEVLVLRLAAELGETAETMRARHTNME